LVLQRLQQLPAPDEISFGTAMHAALQSSAWRQSLALGVRCHGNLWKPVETCGNLWKPEDFGVNFQNFSILLLWMVVGLMWVFV